MWVTRLLLVTSCAFGFAHTGRAASFDVSFLSNGASIGRGSFSIPDADLSLPAVNVSRFTGFSLTTGGATFGLADLKAGTYLPGTNQFRFDEITPSGFGYVLNTLSDLTPNALAFLVTGSQYEPCYVLGQCGPQYPPVFRGYTVSTGTLSNGGFSQRYSASFDSLLITPAASPVPEPGAASLLGASVAGLAFLARRRRAG